MDRFSACYFCGQTDGVGETRVTGSDAATVSLCPDCAGKLDRLAAAAGDDLSLTDAADTGTDHAGSPDHSEEPGDAAPTSAAGEDTPETDGTTPASGADEDPGLREGTSRSFTASQAAGGRPESGSADRGTDDPTEDGDGETDAGATPESPAGDAADDVPASDSGSGPGRGTDAETESEAASPGPSEADVTAVPRQTYNKVVRLLQNRSFPVERSAVVSVATTAYGLSRRDCDRAIDALVDRDVLAESDDGETLYRSGDGKA